MSASTDAILPLTIAQRDIWFDQLIEPEAAKYNIGGIIHLSGVEPERLQQAHHQLCRELVVVKRRDLWLSCDAQSSCGRRRFPSVWTEVCCVVLRLFVC